MSTLRPFISDAAPGGIQRTWQDDGEGGGVVVSRQDVQPLLERNKAQALHNDGYSPSRELRRVAYVPAIVRNKWLVEEGWDAYRPDLYADKLVAKFNDPEWSYLRTAPGVVAVNQSGGFR